MKVILLPFLLLLSSTFIVAQELPEWYRVYTFDESIIEMNTSDVVIGGDIGRVTFRWTFDQPEVLPGAARQKYKSRLEQIELNCVDKQYRVYEITYLDGAGKKITAQQMNSPYEWHRVHWGSVSEKMLAQACQLIDRSVRKIMGVTPTSDNEIGSDEVAKFALSFSRSLEQTKDFKPMIQKFFVADYLNRYLNDNETNWFYNLNRDAAARASHADLQRFYVAQLNAGYLTALYLISQSHSDDESDQDDSAQEAKLIPADIYQLMNSHPYTLKYKGKQGNYDYLAESIDTIERMRSYADLLERIAVLMRRHLTKVLSQRPEESEDILDESDVKYRICSSECLGLPRGTKLFEIDLPLLRFQIAEIKGELKIVSATDSSH